MGYDFLVRCTRNGLNRTFFQKNSSTIFSSRTHTVTTFRKLLVPSVPSDTDLLEDSTDQSSPVGRFLKKKATSTRLDHLTVEFQF